MPTGINFALFARHAETATLVFGLKDEQDPFDAARVEIKLDPALHKTGDIWHVLLTDLPQHTQQIRYGWRLTGPYEPGTSGLAYDQELILVDPYAKELRSPPWGEQRSGIGKQTFGLIPEEQYDWEGDRPLNIPLQDTIIYELHVRGFTVHPSSQCLFPGTFQGIVEKIPYLKDLGITAVELMPVTEFDETDCPFHNPETGQALHNYWGYSPLSFFAPKASYSSDMSHPLREFRDMVKALHRAGIEVILDIVFNHTAEGGWAGKTSSFRGIDNPIYYLLNPWTREYLNFSGCGNTCNCNHPIVRTLIMDALHWWVMEMHVDGFRFDLASILGRDQQGHVLSNPPMVEMIAEDPILAKTKIIAEAWDAAGLYQVGNFSPHHRWAEWNGKFRDDVRRFMNGTPGLTGVLATRLAGSSDLYQQHGRKPCNSINFITSHDGFTLADLVSYNHKHNAANGEDNRDGENNNLSWNSGVEGPSQDKSILQLRRRRIKTFASLLFLSQGVPMLVAGDELGRSQQGNNNAWCQDNPISWLDWSLRKKNADLFRFFKQLIQLRRDHAIFRRTEFFSKGPEQQEHRQNIFWYGPKGVPDWSATSQSLAFVLVDAAADQSNFLILLNGNPQHEQVFILPRAKLAVKEWVWKKIIDTAQEAPKDFVSLKQALQYTAGKQVRVAPMGCVVLQSQEQKRNKR
jgi:glycogen operon protein